jgi:integrase/recombinase XerD
MGAELVEFVEYIEILEKSRKSKDTIRAYQHNVERFLEHFKVESCEKLDKLKYKDFILYQNHLLESGLAESSVNTHIREIKSFLNFLIKCEVISNTAINKLKSLREPEKIRELLTDEEVETLIEKSETIEDKLVIALMYITGVRRSALVNIKRSDIIGQRILFVEKRKKERSIFIVDPIFELLNKYLATHNSEYVFPSNKKDGSISTESVRLKVKKAAKLAGIDPRRIEKITPHSLRRSIGSYYLNAGEDNFFVRDFLGHKDSSTTQRYAKLHSSSMDKIVANHVIEIR